MRTFKEIQSLIEKEDLIFKSMNVFNNLYGEFYNACEQLNKLSSLYIYNYNEMQEEYKKLLLKIYTNVNFSESYEKYHNKLNTYKSILKDLNGTLKYKNAILNINNINSFFIVEREYYSSREEIYMVINNKKYKTKYLYYKTHKKYTKIINYLGLLNEFQYNILMNNNSSLSSYLFFKLNLTPQHLSINDLREQLYSIITDYIFDKNNITINDIKKHWLLPKFTNTDVNYFNKIFAKTLLAKI